MILKRFGLPTIDIPTVEGVVEAPCQLILQMHVLFRGQNPGKCYKYSISKFLGVIFKKELSLPKYKWKYSIATK